MCLLLTGCMNVWMYFLAITYSIKGELTFIINKVVMFITCAIITAIIITLHLPSYDS